VAISILEENLRLFRDQGLQAIRLNSNSQLRRIVDKHLELLGYYIAALARFKTKVQSIKMTFVSLAGYESTVVYEITQSLAELLREAFRSSQLDLIVSMTSSLVRWESLTFDHRNLSLFRTSIKLVDEALQRAILVEDARIRGHVVHNICDIQTEFARIHLQWQGLEKTSQIADDFADFAKALMSIFINGAKLALEKRDYDSFAELVDSLFEIFAVGSHDPSSELLILETRIKFYGDPAGIPKENTAQVERLRKQVSFYKTLRDDKQKNLFALGGYATKLFEEGKLSTEELGKIFEKLLPLLGGFQSISELFLSMQTSDVGTRYGWSLWGVENELRRGPIQMWTNEDSWLAAFFSVASLKTVPPALDSRELLNAINLEGVPSETLRNIATVLRSNWQRMFEKPEKWNGLFPTSQELGNIESTPLADLKPKVERLAAWWDHLATARASVEQAQLIRAKVPTEIVELFESEFRKALNEYSPIRKLASISGACDDLTNLQIDPTVQRIGRNLLENKEWFLPGREYSAKAIGENFGKSFATYETETAFLKIISNIRVDLAADVKGIVQALNTFIDGIEPNQTQSYLILTSVGYELEDELYQSQNFDPSSKRVKQNDVLGCRGKFKAIPVVDIWVRQETLVRTVVCLDLKRFGVWLQYSSGKIGSDLNISVDTLDWEKARELIEKNPKLRTAPDGKEQDIETTVQYLLNKVHVQIWERFSFEILDPHGTFRADFRIPE
jgi:hypothetical protein